MENLSTPYSKEKKIAGIYIRVSTEDQAREDQERMAQAVEIEENHEQERKYYYEK